jgi:hypothetical protein
MFDCQLWLCGHGETKDFTVMCLTNAFQGSKYRYELAYMSGDALIGRSRSVAATRFLAENKAPYMIFIDTDIIFTVEELDKILTSMQAGYDIIAGAYSVASGDRLAIRGWQQDVIIDGRILEVEYISTGFFGISRKALEAIRDKCPLSWIKWVGNDATLHSQIGLPLLHKGEWCECYPFFEAGATALENNEPFYISEDWDFCNKARKVGIKTYFHTGVLVDHTKTTVINAEQMLATHSLQKVNQANPEISLLTDISEFMGKPFEEVKNLVLSYRVKDNKTDDEWLIELAQFNSFEYYKTQRMAGIANFGGLHILDYGCGIGTTAIMLSKKNVVVGYDQNKRLIDFCNYRTQKNGFLNLTFTAEEPDLSQFDVIIFIDVLEHFQELEPFIKHLGEKVHSGCRIYHFDAFFDHATPGHFDHSAMINDYWKSAGFVPFDNLWVVKI